MGITSGFMCVYLEHSRGSGCLFVEADMLSSASHKEEEEGVLVVRLWMVSSSHCSGPRAQCPT